MIPAIVKATSKQRPFQNFLRDETKPYEPWETNFRCLKSIRYKHHKPAKVRREQKWKLTSAKPNLLIEPIASYTVVPLSLSKSKSSKSEEQAGSGSEHQDSTVRFSNSRPITVQGVERSETPCPAPPIQQQLKSRLPLDSKNKESQLFRYDSQLQTLKNALSRAIVNRQIDIEKLGEISIEDFTKFCDEEAKRQEVRQRNKVKKKD